MSIKEIAGRIGEASRAADAVMEEYRLLTNPGVNELEAALKQYISLKLQLAEKNVSDNITIMVRISVSEATGIPLEKLKELDKPGACGSAPAVLAKRVLLFVDIQKRLGVSLPTDKLYYIQTIQDLAEIILPLIQTAKNGDRIA